MTSSDAATGGVVVERGVAGDEGLAWRWRAFRHLEGRGVAPTPVALVRGRHEDLLLWRRPGGAAADAPEHRVDVVATVAEMARALGVLHHTTLPGAPSVDVAARARRVVERLRAGGVDPSSVDPAYARTSPALLADRLEAGIELHAVPGPATLVVGRATLDHFHLDGGRATGFVEWTRSGRGDPHLDLAVAARSLARLSTHLVPELVRHYPGPDPDLARLDWYQLLTALDP